MATTTRTAADRYFARRASEPGYSEAYDEARRAPKMFHLCRDPFERADENSNTYWDWMISHIYKIYEMQGLVAQQIQDFVKYPPRQKPASFDLDVVMRQLEEMHSSEGH